MVVVDRICTWEWVIFLAMIVGGYRDGGLDPRPRSGRGKAFRGDDGVGGHDGTVGWRDEDLSSSPQPGRGLAFRGAEVQLEYGVDEAAGDGVGEKHRGDVAGFGAFLGVAAPLEVAAELVEGVEGAGHGLRCAGLWIACQGGACCRRRPRPIRRRSAQRCAGYGVRLEGRRTCVAGT